MIAARGDARAMNGPVKTESRCGGQEPLSKLLTAIVLTFNEEANLESCLRSIPPDVETFVVDSGSEDRTQEIARMHGAHVIVHPYENHAAQWAWAITHCPIRTPWILALDADFVVSEELAKKLRSSLHDIPGRVNGIYVRHFYRFGGGLVRFGGQKKYWLRLVRHGEAVPDRGDLVDFRFVVRGDTLAWKEGVVEYNRKDDDISVWIAKQDKFALRLAVEEELRVRGLHGWDGKPRLFGNTDQRVAWLRDRWTQLPLFVRPVLYFLFRYIIAGGFLDGRAGFLYHLLQGLWLRILVDVKRSELQELALSDEMLKMFAKNMLRMATGSTRAVAATILAGCVPERKPVDVMCGDE